MMMMMMEQTAQVAVTASKDGTPLLFGKRQPLASDDGRQYAGTDTERDIKG
jgi:hypothetical protein